MKINPNKIEILSPAGDAEQLRASVLSGADAVYLGASGFNARRKAGNFDDGALREAVAFCHERNVKVYVTVNILISDRELDGLVSLARLLNEAGADGVIVQDLAAAAVFRRCCPQMRLHASTQMTVHNAAGMRALRELGFVRAVPARELELGELRSLADAAGLEIESFVHGALCMSVSGCCYISSMLGGRSGNRGLCAQACRLDFTARGRNYALSLKDLSYIGRIGELAGAGVRSLKIEGRMKRPEYASAATDACVRARAGEPYDEKILRDVFSRSGFTDGYLTGKRDIGMFGCRTYEDVTAATEKVFAPLRELYRKEKPRVPLTASLTVADDGSALTLTDGAHTVCARGAAGLAPQGAGTNADNAYKNISKTGGTPYSIEKERFAFENPRDLYLPASALNALRRDALERLAEKRRTPESRVFHDFDYPLPAGEHAEKGFYLRFARAEQAFDCGAEKMFFPLRELLRHPELTDRYGERLCAEAPALVFAKDEPMFERDLAYLRTLGVRTVRADNLGQAFLLRERGFEVYGGFGLNIFNSVALNEYKKLGISEAELSFELSAADIRKIKTDIPISAVVYGRLPLMKYRVCPLRGEKGCGSCPGRGTVADRKGVEFPLACEDRKFTVMYNSVPLDVLNRDFSFVDHKILYFTGESAAECARVFTCARAGRTAAEKHTAGLYYREVF
ncbi:MAG: U32 family peptidase [Clostridia bacterium]|nr:U32 family peptidase [Clostridia bacterium]